MVAAHQLTYKYTKSFIIGGNFIAKRKVLRDMGGFDTNITFYGDDTNIARRICEFGKVLFLPEFYVLSSGRRIACPGSRKIGRLVRAQFLLRILLPQTCYRQRLCQRPINRLSKIAAIVTDCRQHCGIPVWSCGAPSRR